MPAPNSVPSAMATTLIRTLSPKPRRSSGVHFARTSTTEAGPGPPCAEPTATRVMRVASPSATPARAVEGTPGASGPPARRSTGERGRTTARGRSRMLIAYARHPQGMLELRHSEDEDSDQGHIDDQQDVHHLRHVDRIRPDLAARIEHLRDRDRVGDRRRLDEVDQIVVERRKADPEGERQYHVDIRLQAGVAERLGGLGGGAR